MNSASVFTIKTVDTQVQLNAGGFVELHVYQGSGSRLILGRFRDYSPVFATHPLGP